MRPREVREDERGAAHEHQNRARGHEEDAQGDMTSHEGPRGGSAPLAASEEEKCHLKALPACFIHSY